MARQVSTRRVRDRKKAPEQTSGDARLTHWYLDQIKYLSRPLRIETDARGEPESVVLPIAEFRELLRHQEMLAWLVQGVYETWKDEPTIPFEEVVARMKADGLLPS